jgi:SAM-dependent methyltransferase
MSRLDSKSEKAPMRVDIQREPFRPSARSLSIVEKCTEEIAPDEQRLADWHRSFVAGHKERIAFDLDIVRSNVPHNCSILELGSIPLLLTTALSTLDYEVTGCDLAPERYTSTIKSTGIHVVKCDIEAERLPFPDNSFDAVVFNELFEHLRINPIFTLSEVLRVMKPGATLMLSTPNLRSWGGMKNYLLHNRAYSCCGDTFAEYQKLAKLGHMGHVREYTTREIAEFMRRIGFQLTRLIFRGAYPTLFARSLIRTVPSLSPFVSYVAMKPPSTSVGYDVRQLAKPA